MSRRRRVVRILGVDCGPTGALAVVEIVNGVPMLVDITDTPVIGTGAKAHVDVIATAAWIAKHAPSMAYIERSQAFPAQGRSSAFVYGRVTGALEAAVTLCGSP